MNKSDFVAELAAKAGISKADAQKAVNAFAEVLHEQAKKGEKIAIVGLGTFCKRTCCSYRYQPSY